MSTRTVTALTILRRGTLGAMPLTLEQSQTLIAAAHEHAYAAGLNVTVAVVDEGGLLMALGRMDGAPPLSAQIAEAKAAGAAVWHRDGDQLASVQDQRGAFFESVSRLTRLPLIPADGSVLIRDGGAVVGAAGVSGAKPEEDRECAEAGLRAVVD
jgi:glc operon protein GlcG